MGKCASKQQQQQQLKAHSSGFHQRNRHQELLQQQIFNVYKKNNKRTVGADASRSSISEQSIFLLIENEVMPFYPAAQSFIISVLLTLSAFRSSVCVLFITFIFDSRNIL